MVLLVVQVCAGCAGADAGVAKNIDAAVDDDVGGGTDTATGSETDTATDTATDTETGSGTGSDDVVDGGDDTEVGGSYFGGFQIFFGDFHAHTGFSDGVLTPEVAFLRAKESGKGDFLAITDHEYPTDTSGTLSISESEWAETKAQAAAFTDATFVAIAAFEFYTIDGEVNTFDAELTTTYQESVLDYLDFLGAESPGSFGQLNHPLVKSLDFDDFAGWSEARDAVVELIEVENAKYVSSLEVDYEGSYVKALDAGWRVGPAANSDTHYADWLTGTENRTAVFAKSLTMKKIFGAVRRHQVYATGDRNLRVWFQLEDQFIGGEVDIAPSFELAVHVEDPNSGKDGDRIVLLELVGVGGKVVEARQVDDNVVVWEEMIYGVESGYLYLRVTAADGQKAYTAPIWILGESPVENGV